MYDLVIIGGGVAGLTAGIYAAGRGVSCVVIEKNKSGAGALCAWRRGGYEIDGCLHWLTGTREGTELYGIWQKTGVLDGGCVRTSSFFSSTTDGVTVTFYDDAERTKEEMISLFPEDTKEILKFHRAVRAASSLSGQGDMKTCECMLTLAPYALLSASELSERFKSRGMKRAICDLTGGSYSSLGLIFAYSAYSSGNGYLPRGGSRGAAERMRERYLSLGGELTSGIEARKIERRLRGYEVILSNGERVAARCAMCCIDPTLGAATLMGIPLPSAYLSKLRQKEKYPLFSSVHVALAAPYDDVPFKGTSFFSCRPHSVGNVNRDRMMVREFSHEQSFAPRGMSVLQTMCFTDERRSERWISLRRRGDDYASAKERAASECVSRIEEQYPSLTGKLRVLDSWTPATFSRYLGSRGGSYMSFALTPATIPASFPRRISGGGGVCFASQWSRSPGGLPNAALAGVRAIESIFG